MDNDVPPTPLWTGWGRRSKGGRWFRLCEASTINQCARLLDAEGKRLGIADRHQFLVYGDHPPREGGSPDNQQPTEGGQSERPIPSP
jgi:hypothetical protein